MRKERKRKERVHSPRHRFSRKGVVAALTAVLLPVIGGFLAFGIDSSRIAMTKTQLQNGVDAAALAAAQEITSAINRAGEEGGSLQLTTGGEAIETARQIAVDVAARNGVYLDPHRDVVFGKRTMNYSSGEWSIAWNTSPFNTVKVTALRTNSDTSAPDGKLPLLFGMFVGKPTMALSSSAAAFVEARDLVVVMDFSGSMNDDSELRWSSISRLGETAVVENLANIYYALDPPDAGTLPVYPEYMRVEGENEAQGPIPKVHVTFKDDEIFAESTKDLSNVVLLLENGAHYKYDDLNQGPTGTFASPNGEGIVGCWIKSGQNACGDETLANMGYGEWIDNSVQAVLAHYELDSTPYPYPSGSWYDYVNYCRQNNGTLDNAGYRFQYGGVPFANYLLERRPSYNETPDLWRTPHYPFHAIKEGCSLFCSFLEELGFGDEVGLVSYDSTARVEDYLDLDGQVINLQSDPISRQYDQIDTIQRHKQASHYAAYTATGDGMDVARSLLRAHGREGAKHTILLMTDGCANRYPSGWSTPPGWSWSDYTDFNDDGTADYATGDLAKQYAFYQAMEAVRENCVIHTLSVGTNADRQLMSAIAQASGGVAISVPGGATVAELESQLLDAFGEVAAKVPPPKLIYTDLD